MEVHSKFSILLTWSIANIHMFYEIRRWENAKT